MGIKRVQSIADRIAQGELDFGRVAVKQDGQFYLLNYTSEATYSGDMTEVERICRGLVVSSDGKIVALPMEKFFNLGEPQCPSLPDEPYTVWEKLDGSLGIFWHDGHQWRCNTRGSFENAYTRFAITLWDEQKYGIDFPERYTVMCEVCIDNDENPRAAYHPEGLYLIAVADRYSGKDIPIPEIETSIPKAQRVNVTIDQLLDRRQDEEGHEGWVIRFDSGLRVKVKTTWYLRVFRAMKTLSPKRIRELMVDAGEDWLSSFPDDLRPEALEIQGRIETQFRNELDRVYRAYSRVARIDSRKEYAQRVLSEYPDIAHWLFRMRDDKFRESDLLMSLEDL